MFKKFLAKLLLTNLILMSFSFVMPQTLSADEPGDAAGAAPAAPAAPDAPAAPAKVSPANQIKTALSFPLKDAEEAPCIQLTTKKDGTEKKGPDEGYIITIIEEPLYEEKIGETGIDGTGDDYVSRICYRNYFAFTPPGEVPVTKSELSTMCSETGKKAFLDKKSQKDFNIRFTCQRVQVLLTRGGGSTIAGYVNVIYRWAASIVGIIAVTVIIISAIQISLAGGESTGIDEAKKRIMQSLLGIAILFLSALILNFINPNFFTF
ncbi:hypothetical protein HY604_00930 [Candidatus Peregrinibacteria bacterium]|nr:hypothetical protein [Candidatus Peregrinibacteria bacterium]